MIKELLTHENLLRLAPAGNKDLRNYSLLLAAMASYHPATEKLLDLVQAPGPWVHTIPAGLAAAAAGNLIAKRFLEVSPRRIDWKLLGDKFIDNSPVRINSDVKLPTPEEWEQWDGVMLGYTVDTGKPIIVDWDHWQRHAFIIGQSGVGKTVLGEWLMFQQIIRGGGMIFVDGKLDEGNIKKLNQMATYAGRRQDLMVINPGDPSNSNTYNPILYGDPDEIASRILSLIPSSENNPGSDYYRQAANQALTTLVGAIKSIHGNAHIAGVNGMAYNFMDLSILLQNQKAIEHLERMVPQNVDGGRQFRLWLDQFKSVNKEGVVNIDLKKMRDLFGGVGGRMHMFGSGNFGEITSTYSPDVNVFDAVMNNKIIYVALPTMGKAEAAQNFGKMFVGDYRTAVSWIQGTPKEKRPWPPTLCFFDEAGSYVTQAWARIFEQARSANQVLVPAVQTLANLDAVSPELRSMVIGNTWTKIIFKLGEDQTIETLNKLIGTEYIAQSSVSYSESGSESKQMTGEGESTGDSSGVSVGFRQVEEARIKPTTISAMGKGEAIVLYGNSQLYHIKIPLVDFKSEFKDQVGKFQVNNTKPQVVKGLELYRNAEKFFTT